MKKKEWILTGVIVLAALIMLAGMKYMNSGSSGCLPVQTAGPDGSAPVPDYQAEGEWIAVVHRNKIILYFDSGTAGEYEVEGNVGRMRIEVKDGRWHVKEVDCYDYTCRNMGWADTDSIFPIICLPNDLVIIDAKTASEMVTR